MDDSKIETGPWKKLRILGSGGFGQVMLWYNSTTGQRLAIKKLHEATLKDAANKDKQTERWCKEVEIMKKLNHVNIVSTLEVPQELKKTSPLPILAMEYCSKGDLRQVLNKPENCCGLGEPDVVDILKDISSALAYLHSCKIIHRDLKPDNIVLQEKESRTVYKLIDLGYAKALDQSSLSKSFVGTIQYIAPELFLGKAYTSSVDYWSLGLLTHEIITGFRPFMPGFNPSDWMKRVQNKAREVICVMENENGDIIFSSTISRKNHMSRCFLKDIEKWLQLALDWDGQTRGRDPERNRPVIFEELANVLCKKVIKVFSLPTYETLSYEVKPETDVTDLKRWLKEDTNLEEDDQLLLLPSGKALNSNGGLLTALKMEKLDRKGISVFLYSSGPIKLKRYEEVKPKFVEALLQSGDKQYKYRHLKRHCADAIYFLQFEAIRYSNVRRGIKAKINNTKQKTLAIESLYEDVGDEWNQVENYAQFLSLSHKVDLENYIYYRRNGKLESSLLVRKWIQNVIEVEKKITELKNSFNKSEQKQLVLVARQRCRFLDTDTESEDGQKTPLDDIVNEGLKLWMTVQRVWKDQREVLMSNSSATHLVKKCIEETSKLLESPVFGSLFVKISEADENLVKFLSHLTTLLKSTRIMKLVIENTQKERQKEVWNLIGTAKAEVSERGQVNGKVEDVGEGKIDSKGGVDQINGNHVFKSGSPNTNGLSVDDIAPKNSNSNKMTVSEFLLSRQSDSDLNSNDFDDVSSIISDNNHLRYRIQDAQQSCHQMVKEIRSLNWDFIEKS